MSEALQMFVQPDLFTDNPAQENIIHERGKQAIINEIIIDELKSQGMDEEL